MNDSVALITGGASGIGKAIVQRFVDEGARVLICDIDEELGRSTSEQMGKSAVFVRTDVSNAGDLENAVEACVSHFGKLDIIVNNAGFGGAFGRVEEIDEHEWDRTFQVLVKGVFLGTKYAVPEIRKAGGGSIINISSASALLGGYGGLPYATAKSALMFFSRQLALELADDNIRVNAISPGYISTPLATSLKSSDQEEINQRASKLRENLIGPQPLERLGQPEDVANAVFYLASDQGQFVTGQNLVVDGGLSAGRVKKLQPRFFYGTN